MIAKIIVFFLIFAAGAGFNSEILVGLAFAYLMAAITQ